MRKDLAEAADNETAPRIFPPRVVQMCNIIGDGEQKLVVLTDDGKLHERVRDPRNFDSRSGPKYLWKDIEGP